MVHIIDKIYTIKYCDYKIIYILLIKGIAYMNNNVIKQYKINIYNKNREEWKN